MQSPLHQSLETEASLFNFFKVWTIWKAFPKERKWCSSLIIYCRERQFLMRFLRNLQGGFLSKKILWNRKSWISIMRLWLYDFFPYVCRIHQVLNACILHYQNSEFKVVYASIFLCAFWKRDMWVQQSNMILLNKKMQFDVYSENQALSFFKTKWEKAQLFIHVLINCTTWSFKGRFESL